MTGVGLQNAGIGIETSRRFRAERSGTLAYTSYNNRTLNMFNITDRCKRIGGIWCECVNNNLDQYTCGYLLGSSYSVGNGGNIHVELRTNTAKGTPSNVVLGRTESFIPMDNAKVGYPKLKFTTQPTIQEGVIYHLVYVNKSPPLGACTKLVRLTPSEAKQCSKSRGAQGLNGPRYLSNPWRTGTPTTTGARGPYFGDNSAATFYRRKQESGWSFYKDNISWFDVIYNDGVRVGDAYYPIYITRYRNSVGGGNQVRQKFTVQDATRSVDGVWLNFGHTKTADGSPIQVTLKNGSGTVLATNRLNASQQCIKTVREDKLELAGWCLDWGYSSFGKNVSLVKGSTYSVELSAGGNAGFLFGATGMVPAWTNRNTWIKSGAQFSKNNGSSWSNWNGQSGGADAERDLTLLFTIEGMPKQIK